MLQRSNATVCLLGGLGNQLFQITFGELISTLLNWEVSYDYSHSSLRKNENGLPDVSDINLVSLDKFSSIEFSYSSSKLRNLAVRTSALSGISSNLRRRIVEELLNVSLVLQSTKGSKSVHTNLAAGLGYHAVPLKTTDNPHYFIGYFQTKSCLKTLLEMNSGFRERLQNFVLSESQNWKHLDPLNSAIIHVRRSDYVSESFGLLSANYYNKAIAHVITERNVKKIFLISDENSENLQEFITSLNFEVTYLETKKLASKSLLGLMAQYGTIVGANSSLSWWAASIGELDGVRRVYFPNPWFKSGYTPSTLIRHQWKEISGEIWE